MLSRNLDIDELRKIQIHAERRNVLVLKLYYALHGLINEINLMFVSCFFFDVSSIWQDQS